MGKVIWLVTGLVLGAIGSAGGLLYLQAQRSSAAADEIMFARKMFYWNSAGGAEYVAASGTLTGEGLGYPNNTHAIMCWSDRKECYVSDIEQIGPNQIGRLDGPYSYPVVKWTAAQVVAQEGPTSLACSRTTITIDRKSEAVLWVEEPINQTQPSCKNSETRIRKYSLEDSLGVKRLDAAVKSSSR